MSLAIRCRNLHKTYDSRTGPVHAVRGLDLDVRFGECFGLLGPNGAGKTTTIEILEGLSTATSGEVLILGNRWGVNDNSLRQRIGITLQETQFSEKQTVRETLQIFRSFYHHGLDPESLIQKVELSEKARSYVGKLSGGQKQRLSVACALIGDPELLFLDEPTTGLDPQSRRQLWEILLDFQRQGRTVLLTTHNLDEAERLCNRVAIVDHGKVIALGSPDELIAGLGGEHHIEFALQDGHSYDESALRELPTVADVHIADGDYWLAVTEPHVAIPALMDRLQQRGLVLSRLTTRHVSLEDVFVKLTGRRLQDDETTETRTA